MEYAATGTIPTKEDVVIEGVFFNAAEELVEESK